MKRTISRFAIAFGLVLVLLTPAAGQALANFEAVQGTPNQYPNR